MDTSIPETHRNILTEPNHAVLTTVMPDGTPQSSLVWVDYDGEHIIISTTLERQKGRNIQANPNVALLVMDPRDQARWIALHGVVVKITDEDAEVILDDLTMRYRGLVHYYGDIFPVEQREKETRVTVKIQPVLVEVENQ